MPQTPISARIRRLFVVLAALGVFFATTLSFANAVWGGFVNWDDDKYVTANPLVQQLTAANIAQMFTSTPFYAYVPLTLLSHAVDVALWGLSPNGHHRTNVLLHAANATLLFLVLMLVLNSVRQREAEGQPFLPRVTSSVLVGAIAGSLLFALHPQRVESVAWVSGRKDLLCALFLLSSFAVYILWRRRNKKRMLVLSVVLFALALLAKPAAMPFALILIAVDVWLLPRPQQQSSSPAALLADKIPFLLLAAAAAFVAMIAAPTGHVNPIADLNILQRTLLPFYMFTFYIVKLVGPVDLSPVYPRLNPFLLYISPLLICGALWAAYRALLRGSAAALTAVVAYLLMVLPTFLGISSGAQPLADRYSYLSTLSIFMVLGGAIDVLWKHSARSPGKLYQRLAIAVVLCMLFAVGSYRSIRQTYVWENSITLWNQALRYAPATREDYEAGRPYVKPDFLDAYVNSGAAHYAAGDATRAMEQFRQAIVLDSCATDAHYNLGVILFERGDPTAALLSFSQAVTCDPLYAKAFHNLGVAHLKMGNNAAAVDAFRQAARLGFPDSQALLQQQNIPW